MKMLLHLTIILIVLFSSITVKNAKANDSIKHEVKIVKVDTILIDKATDKIIDKTTENFYFIKEDNQKYINYITLFATPLIALIAVWIAYQQWIVQRYNLKLGLLERRMKVFDEVNKAFAKIFDNPTFIDNDYRIELFRQVGYSKFLFNKIISDQIAKIAENIVKLRNERQELKGLPEGERREKLATSIDQTTIWLIEESKVFDEKLIRFMAINRI